MQTLNELLTNNSTPLLVQAEDGTVALLQSRVGSKVYGVLMQVSTHGYQSSGTILVLNGDESTWILL